MSEIYVPKDALEILNEVIQFSKQVEANNNIYREGSWAVLGPEEITKFQQDFDRLKSAVDLLPYKWCEMDPFTYTCHPYERFPEDDCLGFFTDYHKGPEDFVEVPYEIFHIVKAFSVTEEKINKYEFATTVRRKLSSLKEKVKLRVQKVSQSGNGNDPKSLINSETVEPKLTNGGRTIVCAKGTFTFTAQQAKVVKVMWEKASESRDFHSEQDILEEAELSKTSFANVFKSRMDEFKSVFERHESEKDLWRLNLD